MELRIRRRLRSPRQINVSLQKPLPWRLDGWSWTLHRLKAEFHFFFFLIWSIIGYVCSLSKGKQCHQVHCKLFGWILWHIKHCWLFNSKSCLYIYIYIYHHHHHVMLVAQISLTLSRHFSYRSSPLAGLLDYIPYPHIVAECMFVLVVLLSLGHMWGP